MDWTEIVRRKHQAAGAALVRSLPNLSVPLADSPWTAPGWVYEGTWWSAFPDAVYPWDPAVIKALREIEPDVIPLTYTAVYRWSNYHEHGRIDEPIIIRRHAIGRYIRDPKGPVYNENEFAITMPSVGFHRKPNYIETIWHDNETRPYGRGIPIGNYMPLDWEAIYWIRDWHDEHMRRLAISRREEGVDGATKAVGAADQPVAQKIDARARAARHRKSEDEYIDRDLRNYYSIEPSDVEWKEAMLGEPEQKHKPAIVVPDVASAISPASHTEGASV